MTAADFWTRANGKVERFNRTTPEEWACAHPYNSEAECAALFGDWLHTYNHQRGHTALGGKSPPDLVPNCVGRTSGQLDEDSQPSRIFGRQR